jgi:hypothetical protein
MKRLLPIFIGKAERLQIFELLTENLREHQVVAALDNSYPGYAEIEAPVLAMFGGKSDLDWVEPAITALSATIPRITLQGFAKLDHFGPDKSGPDAVAKAVAAFFAGPAQTSGAGSNVAVSARAAVADAARPS